MMTKDTAYRRLQKGKGLPSREACEVWLFAITRLLDKAAIYETSRHELLHAALDLFTEFEWDGDEDDQIEKLAESIRARMDVIAQMMTDPQERWTWGLDDEDDAEEGLEHGA